MSNKMKIKKQEVDKLFDPRFCSFKLDGATRGHVEKLAHSEEVDKYIRVILEELLQEDEANKNTLSYDSLAKLHKYLQRADESYVETPFWVFQDQCKCIKPKPRENKELEARLARLRLKDSQNWYNQATAKVDRVTENKLDELQYSGATNSGSGSASAGEEVKILSGSMVAVINSFLVYICSFFFCFKAVEYSLPEPNIAGQVLFGLLGSTIVACAELYFLARVV